jgi:SAM-dependent methyltransferase
VDAQQWDERYAATELLWSAAPNQFVEAETRDLAPGRALDLAAGEGRNAIWLAERGWRVTVVEFSTVALGKAAKLAEARNVQLELVEADVTTYEPEPGGFDLVLIAYLQTPAGDRAKWLGHAVDALAPGGTLVMVGHDRTNIEHGYGGPQDPSVLTTPDELRAALEARDALVVEKAGIVTRVVQTADDQRTAIDHLVRARAR